MILTSKRTLLYDDPHGARSRNVVVSGLWRGSFTKHGRWRFERISSSDDLYSATKEAEAISKGLSGDKSGPKLSLGAL